jgi:hypothetical protein
LRKLVSGIDQFGAGRYPDSSEVKSHKTQQNVSVCSTRAWCFVQPRVSCSIVHNRKYLQAKFTIFINLQQQKEWVIQHG